MPKLLLLLLILLYLIGIVFGQYLFKVAASSADPNFFLSVIYNVNFIFALILYFLLTFAWVTILANISYFQSIGVVSLTLLGSVLVGHLIFGESLSTVNWIGAFMIIMGVLMLGVDK
jgi:drug/metabolite transporter (DMT)-like permease